MKKIIKIKKNKEFEELINCNLLINKFICYESINNKHETIDNWFIYKIIPSKKVFLAYDFFSKTFREIHYECISLKAYNVYIF